MNSFTKRLVFNSVLIIIPITLSILALGCDMQIKKKEGETEVSSNLADVFTGDATIEQDFSESMPTEAEAGINISHSHGNISVKGWDRDEVRIEGKKIVKAKDEETARMYAEQMRVEVESEGDRIVVKTIRPRPEESWKIRQITINYELYAPENLNVALDSRHGRLQIAQIGKDASVKHEHGDVNISHVGGNAWVSKRHGNIRIESVGGELTLEHQHGNVELDTIEKGADLTKQHGQVNVANVGGMLKIDHEHGRLRLKMIEGDVEIKKQHGEIDVESVNGNVSVHSEHGNLRVIDVGGNVNLTGAHGNAHVENVSGVADISREHSKVSLHNVETANSL